MVLEVNLFTWTVFGQLLSTSVMSIVLPVLYRSKTPWPTRSKAGIYYIKTFSRTTPTMARSRTTGHHQPPPATHFAKWRFFLFLYFSVGTTNAAIQKNDLHFATATIVQLRSREWTKGKTVFSRALLLVVSLSNVTG